MALRIATAFGLLGLLTGNAEAATAAKPPTYQSCAAMLNGQIPSPVPSDFHFSGNVRRYYVAAEEVDWDYAPTGWDNWLGVPMNVSLRAKMAGATQFGTKFLKGLYRGYTDSTFTKYSDQPPWQGAQGPTIRAEVGDLIEIMFVNKLSTYYATMHSMGLAYNKVLEGSDYPNNTMPGQQNVLPPGGAVPPVSKQVSPGSCVVYKWLVNDGSGPPSGQPSLTHSYHSYVAYEQDSDAGLIGPTIIYAAGQMAKTMANYREYTLLYMTYDESSSWLSGVNNARLTGNSSAAKNSPVPNLSSGNYSIWYPQAVNLGGSSGWSAAPSFYAMNGYIFANNPVFESCVNDKVIWYVNAYGSSSHVFHMHGNGVTFNGDPYYAVGLNDGEGKTLFMDAVGAGKWQVICHVANHQTMGMVADYQVYYAGQCPLKALGS